MPTNRDLTPDEIIVLTRLIAESNLQTVLQSISDICGAKGDLIVEQGDKRLGHQWNVCCGLIGVLSTGPEITEVSHD